MLRRLHAKQPASFAFTPANQAWAEAQIKKYPEGREASAILPLLFRAQEQEGWLSKPAIEHVADMLGMAYIRALEVATFYYSFHLSPVGSVAHVQICGTTPCMLRGSEELLDLCRRRIHPEQHHPSTSGALSWEEVECLGACANAPMGQIGKDYYEDLSVESLGGLLDALERGEVPRPGSQVGRFASEPEGGVTSLQALGERREERNASVTLAMSLRDTVKRIDGTETPLLAPWLRTPQPEETPPVPYEEARTETPPDGEQGEAPRAEDVEHTGRPPGVRQPLPDGTTSAPEPRTGGMDPVHGGGASLLGPTPTAETVVPEQAPVTLTAPRPEGADDLRRIRGVDDRLARVLNEIGIFHFDQIADWGAAEVAWVNSRLGEYRGIVERDDLIGQARRLAGRG